LGCYIKSKLTQQNIKVVNSNNSSEATVTLIFFCVRSKPYFKKPILKKLNNSVSHSIKLQQTIHFQKGENKNFHMESKYIGCFINNERDLYMLKINETTNQSR
jgi:hypothetical protein